MQVDWPSYEDQQHRNAVKDSKKVTRSETTVLEEYVVCRIMNLFTRHEEQATKWDGKHIFQGITPLILHTTNPYTSLGHIEIV